MISHSGDKDLPDYRHVSAFYSGKATNDRRIDRAGGTFGFILGTDESATCPYPQPLNSIRGMGHAAGIQKAGEDGKDRETKPCPFSKSKPERTSAQHIPQT